MSITRTMSKHDTLNQTGKPLTAQQASILEADPRVGSYWTEDGDFRVILIKLADGYNYESRRYIVNHTTMEMKASLKYIEVGEPDEEMDA